MRFELNATFERDSSTELPPSYLFIRPPALAKVDDMWSIPFPPSQPIFYWSSDSLGTVVIPEENWANYGIPEIDLKAWIGSFWFTWQYYAVREYLQLKHFPSDGVEYARSHGYPILSRYQDPPSCSDDTDGSVYSDEYDESQSDDYQSDVYEYDESQSDDYESDEPQHDYQSDEPQCYDAGQGSVDMPADGSPKSSSPNAFPSLPASRESQPLRSGCVSPAHCQEYLDPDVSNDNDSEDRTSPGRTTTDGRL
ncbi:hypothetical protein V5O48_009346 [Marasmius crinis-equi]|uniref:Uncharacterized protein n=1 Tax=Marasmius crinis-equi TaxID=585013 RepID=A0ABR3FBX3_9AGAR